ncbi:MAG: alpha/beta hydrolase [Rubrobacteraceae bacterium]|nr:alpha/beta hydrolase [Rubrobacteraceae bacterium]
MTLHPALRELIDDKLAHTVAPQWRLPIEEVRASFRALWSPSMTGAPVEVASVEDKTLDTEVGAVRVRVFTPAADGPMPIMMYFHGGGYVKGGVVDTDAFCRRLARTTGNVVVSVDYRLAPEHPYPAALDDAYHSSLWAYENAGVLGGAKDSFSVCGESAGGNLAAVICLLTRSSPEIEISRQVLLQPVVDFTLSFPSIDMPASECLVPREDLAWYYAEYYGENADIRDFRVSPIFADDLSGLPPALIITAEHDTLRDEARAYADRLESSGVRTKYSCYSGMVHGFLQMAGLVDEAQDAIDEISLFTRPDAADPEVAPSTS